MIEQGTMAPAFDRQFREEIEVIEAALTGFLADSPARAETAPEPLRRLHAAMEYSLTSGGKRFRPVLSLLVARCLQRPLDMVLPFAIAVEMIHTYSLIHDDLPCMDNDDWRRGRPTNHKVYGEALALLAGDALLTEAFGVIARSANTSTPDTALELIRLLADAAGATGMVGGQAHDLAGSGQNQKIEDLKAIHQRKTGCLIRVAAEGAAIAAGATGLERQALRRYGSTLGFAFQLADDMDDHDPNNPEATGFPATLGWPATERLLAETSAEAIEALRPFGAAGQSLSQLVLANQKRVIGDPNRTAHPQLAD